MFNGLEIFVGIPAMCSKDVTALKDYGHLKMVATYYFVNLAPNH